MIFKRNYNNTWYALVSAAWNRDWGEPVSLGGRFGGSGTPPRGGPGPPLADPTFIGGTLNMGFTCVLMENGANFGVKKGSKWPLFGHFYRKKGSGGVKFASKWTVSPRVSAKKPRAKKHVRFNGRFLGHFWVRNLPAKFACVFFL
jgi:hypothetical protein